MKFMMNSWYCVGWSVDLHERPLGIRVLDQELVLFRTSDGTPIALDGRCPHRFAPLSRGKVRGDEIECCYHGLRFNRAGLCTVNPHGKGIIPPRAKVRSYPMQDRNGALWVWMGDPELADAGKIVSFDFVSDRKQWAGVTGYLKINADYQLVIDNLLDLTHATYLHPATVGLDAEHSVGSAMEYEFRIEGTTVHSNYTFRNSPPTALFKPFFNADRGDIYAFMRWEPAGSLVLDISTTTLGSAKGTGVLMPSAHFIVPETDHTCHYFFALSRNVELLDEEKTKAMGQTAMTAFVDEDEPVIRLCGEMMESKEFFELEPAILETDVAGVQARRILTKLIKGEQKREAVGLSLRT
jgi:phenylpropionate dioxygenase-like ring-hydroxylating dioxygenase large terminal subunit